MRICITRVQHWAAEPDRLGEAEILVIAGEIVNIENRIYAEVSFPGRPSKATQPIFVFGKSECKVYS